MSLSYQHRKLDQLFRAKKVEQVMLRDSTDLWHRQHKHMCLAVGGLCPPQSLDSRCMPVKKQLHDIFSMFLIYDIRVSYDRMHYEH